jgi:preprotein translocase subunit SecG
MRLIDALRHLVTGEGADPDTGLGHRERALSRALAIIAAIFLILGFALFAMPYG